MYLQLGCQSSNSDEQCLETNKNKKNCRIRKKEDQCDIICFTIKSQLASRRRQTYGFISSLRETILKREKEKNWSL